MARNFVNRPLKVFCIEIINIFFEMEVQKRSHYITKKINKCLVDVNNSPRTCIDHAT